MIREVRITALGAALIDGRRQEPLYPGPRSGNGASIQSEMVF